MSQPEPVVTMGVEQVAGGLSVTVMRWSDDHESTVLFSGAVHPDASIVLSTAGMFGVRRALVDPSPDQAFAKQLMVARPEVFALQGGSGQNSASLAEVAYHRMGLAEIEAAQEAPTDWQLLKATPSDSAGSVLLHVVVPPDRAGLPTHVVLPLGAPVVVARPDGTRIVEASVDLRTAVVGRNALASGAPLTIAPSSLPLTGWHLVVDLYAGQTLVYEWASSEGEMLGVANLFPEVIRVVQAWITENAVNVELQYPDANTGPLPMPVVPPY